MTGEDSASSDKEKMKDLEGERVRQRLVAMERLAEKHHSRETPIRNRSSDRSSFGGRRGVFATSIGSQR